MILDFAETGSDALAGRRFDVCIVGAGPAGITIARALSRDLSVLLLEAGGFELSAESQQIYQGSISGRGYYDLDTARLRYFGGTSNHWGGRCQALDAFDFEAHPYVPHSGWPIGKQDLDPYLGQAARIVDLDLVEPEPPAFRSQLDQALATGGFAHPFTFHWSPPTVFGEKFRMEIEQSANILCLLHANLTDIVLSESGSAVTDVEITGYELARTKVPVRRLVIAAGGMENPRILLNCNRQMKAGLGNQHDLVGRFFAEHFLHRCGWLVLEDDFGEAVSAAFPPGTGVRPRKLYYAANRGFALQREVLDFVVTVVPRSKFRDSNDSFSQRLRHAICAPDWLSESFDFTFDDGAPTCYDGFFIVEAEQAPNPDSRITLNGERDQFGWCRLNLDWRALPIDKRTAAVAAAEFATRFAEHNLGRVRVKDWLLADDSAVPPLSDDVAASCHHMGTTRMADDPRRGVVDRNCRVHGISNLYVAGSSVFPTVGFANPTFSIVQMSLRLADHLNGG